MKHRQPAVMMIALFCAHGLVLCAGDTVKPARSDAQRYVTAAPEHLRAMVDAYQLDTGPFVEIVPIDPTAVGLAPYPGGVSVAGDLIAVSGTPQRIWFEIRLGGWGAQDDLCTWQITIDETSFANGTGADLSLPDPIPCVAATECEPIFGIGSQCQPRCTGCQTYCQHAFQNSNRTDLAINGIIACNQNSLMCGSTAWPIGACELDDGSVFYGANLALDVPVGANGFYAVGLESGTTTFMVLRNSGSIPIVTFRSASVAVNTVVPCCGGNQVCVESEIGSCLSTGGTIVRVCMGDCDNSGRDDACEGLADCNSNAVADQCEISSGFAPDCNSNGVPDECDILFGSSTDCNANTVPDECDLASGIGTDCNTNGIMDDCELAGADCDGNGVLDQCELADADCNANRVLDACDVLAGATDCDNNNVPDECQLAEGDCNNSGVLDVCENPDATDCNGNGVADFCELGAGAAVDCNANGVLDDCDIANGTSFDVDGNCIPDECGPSPAPLAESPLVSKSRFLTFTPLNAGCSTALRVRFVSLTPEGVGTKFADLEGTWQWVGPPQLVWEDSRQLEQFQVAPLQCDPYVMEWQGAGLIHVYGPAIMPQSVYDVQHFDAICGDVNNPGCYSDSLIISTDVWGDIVRPYDGEPDAGGQPDFRDISSFVVKFLGNGGPPRVAVELEPNVIDLSLDVDFKDIAACVTSYLDQPYPLDGPTLCQ